MRLAMTLIRLRVCAGFSELLLVAHTTLLEISCHGLSMVEPELLSPANKETFDEIDRLLTIKANIEAQHDSF